MTRCVYFFMREVPFGQDGSYSPETIATRINSDLANGIGNLASRSLSMINKNCDGRMPECGTLTDEDRALLATVDSVIETARAEMANFQIHKALAAIIDVVADGDRYFAGQEPWSLKKTDPTRMETVLYVTAETVRQIAILLLPFMPQSADKLLDMLSAPADSRDFKALGGGGTSQGRHADRQAGTGVPALRRARGGVRRMLIDTHCHLDFADFDAERDDLIERARAAGVMQMVTISTRVRKLDRLLKLTERYGNVFCSVGTHPNNADEELDVTADELVALAESQRQDRGDRRGRARLFLRHARNPKTRRQASCAISEAGPAGRSCRWSSTAEPPMTTWLRS